ncbi:MAG: peptidase T [Solobacterium sp.]|nr:peptidase T [Solobacterium sp.]
MNNSVERLIRYCRIDTQSDPKSGTHPSTAKQFDLANLLVKELLELGLRDASVDEHCYVYAHLPSNLDHPAKTVGFIAHMDTAPDYSGTGVEPCIIENYDGNDIVHSNGLVTRMKDFPYMRSLTGKTLVVTDGNTLLGADDKAGITAIMETLVYYRDNPDEPHGNIAVAFTPDEEIGQGSMFFDVTKMNADFAYTVDGDDVACYSDETFNACSAEVTVKGRAIHPGEAKNKQKNAALIAARYAALLPEYLIPAHTEGREGFIHLGSIHGDMSKAGMEYILRDHDSDKLEGYRKLMRDAALFLNEQYGEGTISVTFEDTYRNMKDVLKDYPEVSALAEQAIRKAGYEPREVAVRGGTDGSNISFMGLPCPNLGDGGGNFHGPHEYCVAEELDDASRIIRFIVSMTAEEPV